MFILRRGAAARVIVVLKHPACPQVSTIRGASLPSRSELLFLDILYPLTEEYSAWTRGDVAISDGVISGLGPALSRDARHIVDGSGLVMLPGLFNVHTHAHDLIWRGSRNDIGVDRSWPDWFWQTYYSVPLETHLAAATATYAMNAMSGVTYVIDHLRRGLPAHPFLELMRSVGIRGRVHSSVAEATGEPVSLLHETSEWFERSLERAANLERRPVMIHAQETQLRLDHVLAHYGKSTIALLDEYGLLHDQTFLVHVGYHSNDDVERIARRGAHVVATPIAEMALGEQTFDPIEAKRSGVSLLIGTDGPAYHNTEDLFRDLHVLSLRVAAVHGPGRLLPGEILSIATWKAGRAIGHPETFPRVGAVADLTLLDATAAGVGPLVRAPFDNVAQQLVHGATRANVRFVVAAGRLIIAEGRLLSLDPSEAFAAACGHAKHPFELH